MFRPNQTIGSLLIFIMIASTPIVVQVTNAQPISKPTVPQFTLKYVDYSYDVPPTYGTNPYNGKTEITVHGQHVDKKTLEVWIKNQVFTPYTDSSGHKIILGYGINWKGHFVNTWTFNPAPENYILASNSEYTVISFGFDGDSRSDYPIHWLSGLITTGDQLDFQVQAFIGYYIITQSSPDPLFHRAYDIEVFTGQTSEWSSSQSIVLEMSGPTVSPQPEYSPQTSSALTSTPLTLIPSPTSIISATINPTINPTATSIQGQTGNRIFANADWMEIVLFAALGVIALLVVTVLVLAHKIRTKSKGI